MTVSRPSLHSRKLCFSHLSWHILKETGHASYPRTQVTLEWAQSMSRTNRKTAMELFKCYLTGRHFTVVSHLVSLICLRNFKEPEGMVARRITRLQSFDFKIVHRHGKHYSHVDGLSLSASLPCQSDTCPECAPLLHPVTPAEDRVRMETPLDPYREHFGGYIKLVEDDSSLFCDGLALVSAAYQEPISPELFCYMGHHPKEDEGPEDPRWSTRLALCATHRRSYCRSRAAVGD